MTDTRQFDFDRQQIAAKVMDGEAIIMNITSGAYYSITGAGAVVWEELERGRTLEEAVQAVMLVYQVAADTARTDAVRLVATLLEEGLLVPAPGRAPAPARPTPAAREPYLEPSYEKYSDMADLLALDPPMPGFDESSWVQADPGSGKA